jgi:hypothetical protein
MDYDDDVDRALWTETKVYMDHPYAVVSGWVVTFLGFGVCYLFGGG